MLNPATEFDARVIAMKWDHWNGPVIMSRKLSTYRTYPIENDRVITKFSLFSEKLNNHLGYDWAKYEGWTHDTLVTLFLNDIN